MARRKRRSWLPQRRWTRVLAAAIALPIFAVAGVAGYYYGRLSLVVEARLAGERVRVIPRVYGRPLALRVGLTLTDVEVVQRLNDLGYSERARASGPGEFTPQPRAVVFVPRRASSPGRCSGPSGRRRPPSPAGQATRPPGRPPRIERLFAGRPAGAAGDARPAAAERARHHVARTAPPGAALGHSRRMCSRRCWRSRTGASTTIPASIRSASSAPLVTNLRGDTAVSGRRQHHHPAAGPEFLPQRGDGAEAQSGQRSIRRKLARAVHGRHPRAQGHARTRSSSST